jgi:hypothetical protein
MHDACLRSVCTSTMPSKIRAHVPTDELFTRLHRGPRSTTAARQPYDRQGHALIPAASKMDFLPMLQNRFLLPKATYLLRCDYVVSYRDLRPPTVVVHPLVCSRVYPALPRLCPSSPVKGTASHLTCPRRGTMKNGHPCVPLSLSLNACDFP